MPKRWSNGVKGWTCDLIPKPLIVARFFADKQAEIDRLTTELEATTAELAQFEEEHGGDEGYLSDLEKINKACVKAQLKELKKEKDAKDEAAILTAWEALSDKETALKAKLKEADAALDAAAYPFFVRSQKVERINSFAYDEEAVLTAGDGVGTGKVFHHINGKYDAHQRVYRIFGFSEKIDGRYFFLIFSNNFYDRIMQMTAKSSVDSVRREMISRMMIPLPELKEQKLIAEALSDADTLIESLEQLLAKKRQIKQGAMQDLLTGKKRLERFGQNSHYKQTELGLIPEDWEILEIGNLGQVGRGRVISHREISRSRSPIYPVYSSQTKDNGVMGYLDTYDFDGEYITWTTDGANAGTVFYRRGKFNCTNVCGTIRVISGFAPYVARILSIHAPNHVSRQLGNSFSRNLDPCILVDPFTDLLEDTL